MINRKVAPPIHEIKHLALPKPVLFHLDNGIPVYVMDFPGQEIVKIEVVFRAGRPEEQVRTAARATARLLREGTLRKSGSEIAEQFDFYGGSISVPTNLDTANFILFSLKKYAAELIPLFSEVLLEPAFPEHELDTYKSSSIHELQVELDKVEVLAYRKITELIFGVNHPYGYNSTIEDYTALTQQDLRDHYTRWYTPANCLIFASGRIDDQIISLLNRHLGQQVFSGQSPVYQHVISDIKPAALHIPHVGSLQTAIKIGRRLFNKQHPDFNGVFVLNTILGGYFGSRLMTNIREKKGFTYNIYSTADAMLYDGCLYIATEVNSDKASATLREILREMKRLREKPVDESELEMVRNYLLGMLLNGLDGPVNSSDVVRTLIVDGLPLSAFDDLVETIRNITPEELQILANRYLQISDFWTVTSG